jgi:hypothetical protein
VKYLNITLADLRSPAFLGADPTERATWLCLSAYCADQENGGVIASCRDWKDRQWQQVAGVTLEEVSTDSGLWVWEGDNLIVGFYPVESEEVMRQKRDGGRRGGLKKNNSTEKDKESLKHNEGVLEGVLEAESQETPSTPRTERNSKGIEREYKCVSLPTREQVLAAAALQGIDARVAGIWFDETDARPVTPDGEWTDRNGRPIARWQSALAAYNAKWVANEQKRPSGAGVRPPSVWEAKQRIDALKRKIEQIRGNPSNKVRKDGSWDMVLIPAAKAQIEELKAKVAEQEGLIAA